MGKSAPIKIFGVALDILQIVFAILVITLTSWRLLNVNVEGFDVDTKCLLDGSSGDGVLTGSKFCIYAIMVGVISLLANIIFGCVGKIFKCITANVCGASRIIQILGDTALGVWWTVAFVFFIQRGTAANNLDWPETAARNGVIAGSFGGLISFFLDVVVTVCGMAGSSSDE